MTFPRMGTTMLVTDVDSKVTNVVILPPTGPPEGTYNGFKTTSSIFD